MTERAQRAREGARDETGGPGGPAGEAWRSPREIDAGPAGRAAGPPPVPAAAPPFAVRPVRPGGSDLDTVHAWMLRPHVARFYDQAWPRERWQRVLAGQLAGDFSRPLLASLDGADLAYLELYRAARDVVGAAYPAEPHDVGLHIAIGRNADTGRGTGPRLIAAVAHAVFAADPHCGRVVMEPDAANAAARAAAERAGLRLLGEVDLPHKRAALLAIDRDAEGVSAGTAAGVAAEPEGPAPRSLR